MVTRIEKLGAGPARVLWGVLALVSTSTFGDALDGRSTAVVVTVAVGLALLWAAGLVALLVARSTSLTALRLVIPAGLAATAAAVAAGGSVDVLDVVTVSVAALAMAAALAPWVSEAWVMGSAYGPERRTPLRIPPLLAVVAALTWLVVVAGTTAGPLFVANGRWIIGGVCWAVGWLLAAAGTRSFHLLARRWVVVVPAGLVIHDPLTMPEAQLFPRASIIRLGPAPATTGNATSEEDEPVTEDLTAGASGLVLELVTDQPVELLMRSGRNRSVTRAAQRILFTPTRPSNLLDTARDRRLPVA